MSEAPRPDTGRSDSDEATLHRLGYAQVLFREIDNGGPVAITWGWFTGWFNLVGQIAVTAFALPIILRIRAGDRFEHGAWNLGNHDKWIAPLAVA